MIPGYAEAVREERRRRNRVEFSIPETVCGVPLRPLTLADVTILQESGCSYFDDSDDAYDAATSLVILLWWQWTCRPQRFLSWRKRRFARRIGRIPSDRANDEASSWMRWMFADAPPHRSSPAGSPPPITSFAVSITDRVASRCSWPRHDIINTPLPILWQHIKIAASMDNPKAPRFNPSDRVKSEYLRSLNEKKQSA